MVGANEKVEKGSRTTIITTKDLTTAKQIDHVSLVGKPGILHGVAPREWCTFATNVSVRVD